MRRRLDRVMASSLAACLLGAALPVSAETPEDPCEGRNPAYCNSGKGGSPAPAAPDAAQAGDCEGRNPLFCKEPEAPAKPAAAGAEETHRQRASEKVVPDGDDADNEDDVVSKNPAHNKNQNPNQNPNRRPPRSRPSAGK
jgi:hypothetical protein